eukprot:4585260-Pyramimonas_sp.AAC.2
MTPYGNIKRAPSVVRAADHGPAAKGHHSGGESFPRGAWGPHFDNPVFAAVHEALRIGQPPPARSPTLTSSTVSSPSRRVTQRPSR